MNANARSPKMAEEMIEALKASIAATKTKAATEAINFGNRVALAHRIGGASPFDAKLAALDALIAQVSR